MKEHWFPVLTFVVIGAVVFDVLFGKTIRWRKWLHGVVVIMFLLVAMSVPRCSTDDANRPDGPDIPYSF